MDDSGTVIKEGNTALFINDDLQVFIDNMPYPVLLVTRERIVIAANEKLCNFLKIPYSPAEVKGKNTIEVLLQIQHLFKNAQEIARRTYEVTGRAQPVLNDRIETADGKVMYRDYTPFLHNGKVVADLWIFHDATETEKNAIAIAEQRQFYEDILNSIPSDIAVLSPSFKYVFVNPDAIRDEATREWIIGKDDFEFCMARGKDLRIAENRRQVFNRALTEKRAVEWEEEMVSHAGAITHHLRRITPVFDNNNNIKLLIGYGFDITERRKYEEQIEVSEKKYRDVFNYSQALICTHDMDGVLLEVNPAFCEQTGYLAEEAVGKKITYFLPEPDKALFDENYLVPVKNRQKVNGIFRVVHKNGSLVYLLYQNFRVEAVGEKTYIISFSQDITERITMEKELKEAKKITEETARLKEKF
ncbi:MAG TPA: PAS domain S-box protein, partial [Chitinophagaceae bacterium]|nr:PAS domain S-box protein [Chitinophagaceae bacterium]